MGIVDNMTNVKCRHCRKSFETDNPFIWYCSSRCRWLDYFRCKADSKVMDALNQAAVKRISRAINKAVADRIERGEAGATYGQ